MAVREPRRPPSVDCSSGPLGPRANKRRFVNLLQQLDRGHLHAFVKRFGSYVSTIRPNDCSDFWVYRHLHEILQAAKGLKHRTFERWADIDFAGGSILETHPQCVVADISDLNDVVHGYSRGSMRLGSSPLRMRFQFSSSSSL